MNLEKNKEADNNQKSLINSNNIKQSEKNKYGDQKGQNLTEKYQLIESSIMKRTKTSM